MSLDASTRIVRALADRGYNADREAVTLLASASDPQAAIERALETVPDGTVVVTADHVKEAVDTPANGPKSAGSSQPTETDESGQSDDSQHPPISTGDSHDQPTDSRDGVPVETKGSENDARGSDFRDRDSTSSGRSPVEPELSGDIQSTGTGEYDDFVSVFRNRYEKLAAQLRGRVNHRPTDAVAEMSGNSDAAIIGMVSDIRSTASGHWLVELEDTNGTFPCLVMKDRDFADDVQTLLYDEVIAVEGSLADDAGILFVDTMHFPDVPRTYTPSTADRPVEAALVSDVHVGSEEFRADAWQRFADWLHTPEAESVEYLLVGGDMVEGVGVYPDQDEELDIVDIYDQYEAFSEHLKDVPGDMEIVMIPGNHDAVRLAEPQPAFDEELRDIMSAHDARITANPSMVTVEGVSVLMYHGTSFDEIIAELPDEHASYENPEGTMAQLLRKRHVAPQYGGMTRIAPEEEDHLVIEEVPDILHTGHIHKLGYGTYHNVLTINSSCWQAQTDFQKSVNLEPDVGYAPIVDLQTLDLTIRQFV
ncbi:DNA-directed DNA polymerase II small subunit [Halovenus aranensis]|uniref:DNA-directed DNA polymerase II small subunit n=1 Tax=Halovenus aranensis TaxID=890420 RepID=UPI000B892114|nr:DNA-directed DNA polymerase II small subunit [Halovenus aranensis]